MTQQLIDSLEEKIGVLVDKYNRLKDDNELLTEEVQQLLGDREGIKSRVDAILEKLDQI